MTSSRLLSLLALLDAGVDPVTQHPFDSRTSCLSHPSIGAAFASFKGVVEQQAQALTEALPDHVLQQTYNELVQIGYHPTVEQMTKVMRGSRSIADPTLRAISGYGEYRSCYSKAQLTRLVRAFASRHPQLFGRKRTLVPTIKATTSKPTKRSTEPSTKQKPGPQKNPAPARPASPKKAAKAKEPSRGPAPSANHPTTSKPAPKKKQSHAYKLGRFFENSRFDNLSEEKATELAKEIGRLPIARPTAKLPAFKARARQNYPRAYEPWSRSEQALLIETMCYTNDAAKIAGLFGRTANSITDQGLKLIYASQQKGCAA